MFEKEVGNQETEFRMDPVAGESSPWSSLQRLDSTASTRMFVSVD